MANYQNHVIDPTYFFDAIEEFRFTYDWYVNSGKTLDDYGRMINSYTKQDINGSLQPEGVRIVQKNEGNIEQMEYKFYCKSLYRISIGDFINYKNKWLWVTEVQDYDEWGVRECTLSQTDLNLHKDLLEYYKYLNGDIII